MGLQNWFSRVLMSTWFREITVIDVENLPSDRGAIIVSWHPGGLFDNMLTQGLLPGEQVKFNGLINDDEELEQIASSVASHNSSISALLRIEVKFASILGLGNLNSKSFISLNLTNYVKFLTPIHHFFQDEIENQKYYLY